MKEHRFAFFYWIKWYREMMNDEEILNAPSLVTIDYHRDLISPTEDEKKELEHILDFDQSDLSLFCWARINNLNDSHILSTVYVNAIKDVVALCHECTEEVSYVDFKDMYGKIHHIYSCKDLETFASRVNDIDSEYIYLDFDMDYFIRNRGGYKSVDGWKIYTKKMMRDFFDNQEFLLEQLRSKIYGLTIALEPDHCGGLLNSFKILFMIEKHLFNKNGDWIA